MSIEPQSQALERSLLSEKEQAALRYYQASNQREIAPDTAGRMFALFLQGRTCDEIHKLNTGFSLGQVVRARVAGEWDRLKEEYLRDLFELTRIRALQETLESTNFVADLLAAARLEFGDKLRRYALSRDPNDRSELRIDSLKDFKDAVALLQALTGQDKQQKVSGEVLHRHDHKHSSEGTKEAVKDAVGEMAPAVAAELLKLLGKPATQRR